MAGRLQTDFGYQKNLNSIKLPNSKLYFYDSGTDTLSTIYADVALSVTQANPVTADSNGDFNNIYLTAGNSIYKIVLKDEKGVTVWTSDNDQPSLNTTIIPLVPGEYDFIFWIESTPEIGSRLEFNGTNVPTLSEASISSNTAIENKTQTNLTVVSGQSYPLTNIDVTASVSGAVSENDKVYFTYSGVDAAYKATNVSESFSSSLSTSDTLSGPSTISIDDAGQYAIGFDGGGTGYAYSISGGTLSSGTVSGSIPAVGSGFKYSLCCQDYAILFPQTSAPVYLARSGSTFTVTGATGLSGFTDVRTTASRDQNGDIVAIANFGSATAFLSRSGTTFSSITTSGGTPVGTPYVTRNGNYIMTAWTTAQVWKKNGSQYDLLDTFGSYFFSFPGCCITEDGLYAIYLTGTSASLWKFNGSTYDAVDTFGSFGNDEKVSMSGDTIYADPLSGSGGWYINRATDTMVAIPTSSFGVVSGQASVTAPYFITPSTLVAIDAAYNINMDVSSTISTEPDSGKVFASPSSATTSEFDCGDTATTITVKSKFSPTSVTVDGSTTSTSLVTDDSNIIQGDYVILSTDGLTPYYGQVGTTTVSVGGGKATYTSDITSIGIGSAPIDCFTGNIVAKSSVQSSSGSPSYTTDTYSSIERDGVNFEITYTTRSVSGRYVQIQTEFDYIDSLDKFYAGLNR